jgi:hypothetical protein
VRISTLTSIIIYVCRPLLPHSLHSSMQAGVSLPALHHSPIPAPFPHASTQSCLHIASANTEHHMPAETGSETLHKQGQNQRWGQRPHKIDNLHVYILKHVDNTCQTPCWNPRANISAESSLDLTHMLPAKSKESTRQPDGHRQTVRPVSQKPTEPALKVYVYQDNSSAMATYILGHQ